MLGCTGAFAPRAAPASSLARFAITSLAFMLVCVPDPVWKTTRGKCSSSRPSITSSAARAISVATSDGSTPSSAFTRAAARFTRPSARIMGRPHTKRSRPIGKWIRARSVCAPQ